MINLKKKPFANLTKKPNAHKDIRVTDAFNVKIMKSRKLDKAI